MHQVSVPATSEFTVCLSTDGQQVAFKL